jgi:glycosyltransferase involved in cell wall biosynthesis
LLNIPIVVAAYNRPDALKRILSSLLASIFTNPVELIISIDGGEDNSSVVDLARGFDWTHGSKQIIVSDVNLGLRGHILKCGRISQQYDGIVLLEDDLYVSKYFYQYVQAAQSFYRSEKRVAGIALYSHAYNETAWLPFAPLDDGSDAYFLQIACSWGQSWLSEQWANFEKWYFKNKDMGFSDDCEIPQDVRLWPETSWKKFFIKYLIVEDMYFVYPKRSLSTNFADPGVNHRGTNLFQVPLLQGDRDYVFPSFQDSIAKYDAYCELDSECMKQLSRDLAEVDLTVDLYGMKNKRDISTEYVLTSQRTDEPIKSFGRKLKPHDFNVLEGMPGDIIHFGLTEDMEEYDNFLRHRSVLIQDYDNTHAYFYALRESHYKPVAVMVKELVVKDSDEDKSMIQKVVVRISLAWRRILDVYGARESK